MAGITPYLTFAGNARAALEQYHSVFGGELTLHTFGDFGRTDGAADAIAHGELTGPVTLFASDAGEGDAALSATQPGLMFALLGTAASDVLTEWFEALAEGGEILDPLQQRPWGDFDGQVRDGNGILWLIGYQQ